MNKKGFTLMELLLVVAVLAIVAAAAAPTFFGGAQEAMEEAKKSSYMSAYQNCVSGTNLLMGIAASQGIIPNANLSFTNKDDEAKTLENYAPRAARVFTNKNGKTYIFGATYDTTNHKVVIGFAEGNESAEPTTLTNTIAITSELPTVEKALLKAWDAVKDVAAN